MVDLLLKIKYSKMIFEERIDIIFKWMDKNLDDKLLLEEFIDGVKEDWFIV